IVDSATAWVSGANGRWARTTDGGATWTGGTVPDADSLQFRDVHAIDASSAYLLSIGNGPQSRIYRTDDAGVTWRLQFRNEEPSAFFDCFDFWDADHGMAFSDSFDGRFLIIETADGGDSWTPIPADRLPPADTGEGSFAASGTCLVVAGDSAGWIGTGASDGAARVLRTVNRGRTWSVVQTPIVRGEAAGIASLAFRDTLNGAALGGDISDPASATDNVAITNDGGATWRLGGRPPFSGAAYGASWVPGAPSPTLVAVGPAGLGYSLDEGRTWAALDTLNHWSVSFVAPNRGWAVGPGGRITRIRLFARE
ncbi:MAG: WD40/YVTN/BNR-like repeat-containing protein, partial [Longimicrobiales bacterium]